MRQEQRLGQGTGIRTSTKKMTRARTMIRKMRRRGIKKKKSTLKSRKVTQQNECGDYDLEYRTVKHG